LKTAGIILITLAVLITLTSNVMADQGVPAPPGASGITSSTLIVADGMVMESSALGISLSNEDIIDYGLGEHGVTLSGWGWDSMLDPTMVQYSTTYDASTIAQGGQTTLIKTLTFDTGDKLLTQSNVKALTEATFMATGDGGNILGTESIMVDGAGMPTSASDRILCPFGGAGDNVIPAFCNIAMANSKYDLVIGSVVSAADDRFIGTDAGVPVVLNLGINVKPYQVMGEGTSPAMGSATSTFKVSVKEGRHGYMGNVSALAQAGQLYTAGNGALPYMDYTNGVHDGLNFHPNVQPLNWNDVGLLIASGNMTGVGIGPKNEDLTYIESSTAVGTFTYNVGYNYGSGMSPMP